MYDFSWTALPWPFGNLETKATPLVDREDGNRFPCLGAQGVLAGRCATAV